MFSIINSSNLNKLYTDYPYLLDFEDNIFLFKKDNQHILPRYFKDNHPKVEEYINVWEDSEFNPKHIDIEFVGDLRSEQVPIMNALTEIYESQGKINGILKAKPGFGKTVCASYLTASFKKKTLIILDNSKLVSQWTEAYLKFTSLTEDDIGFIIGKEFNPKPVTITMVQTLVSKIKSNLKEFYVKMRDAGFDLVFFDETHKTSSGPKFALSSLFLNTSNIIGLTATPYGDQLHSFFMKNIIGDILYEFTDYDNTPDVYFVNYKSGLAKQHFWRVVKSTDYIKRTAFYNSIIHTSKVYLDVILKLTRKLVESNRKSIIIVFTIEQLQTIVQHLRENGIDPRPLYSKEQFVDKENDNVIVATYKLASHGFDYSELSCLILATPLRGKTSLIQTIGRILRKHEGKKTPLVFDLIDHDFGSIFSETINAKKSIISKEFKVIEYKNIDYNMS